MRALKSLLVLALVLAMGSSARADLTILSIDDITPSNSWSVASTVIENPGFEFDLLTVEVTGATFELPIGLALNAPAWSAEQASPGVTYAGGSGHSGNFDVGVTFNGAMPGPGDNVTIVFSAFVPGSDAAFGSAKMVYDEATNSFLQTFGASTTLTRGALGPASAPVPGAVLLGVMGLGMVGVVKKRLI